MLETRKMGWTQGYEVVCFRHWPCKPLLLGIPGCTVFDPYVVWLTQAYENHLHDCKPLAHSYYPDSCAPDTADCTTDLIGCGSSWYLEGPLWKGVCLLALLSVGEIFHLDYPEVVVA
ncbi:hypothetical protein Tco_1150369 [Tanacetum coccineum]